MNKNKALWLVPWLLVLLGCSDTFTKEQVQRASDKCSTNDGVNYYISSANADVGIRTVVCKNGARFTFYEAGGGLKSDPSDG